MLFESHAIEKLKIVFYRMNLKCRIQRHQMSVAEDVTIKNLTIKDVKFLVNLFNRDRILFKTKMQEIRFFPIACHRHNSLLIDGIIEHPDFLVFVSELRFFLNDSDFRQNMSLMFQSHNHNEVIKFLFIQIRL